MAAALVNASSPLDLQFPTEWKKRPRLYTLCLTLRCNLACDYCYVSRNPARMSLETARQAIEFIFRHAASAESIEIGFFGGEPLLEFKLLQTITEMIESHPAYSAGRVRFNMTTNGTIFSEEIAAFLRAHAFKLCISCDGAPQVQDLFRHTRSGKGTAASVERTLLSAQKELPNGVLVNAVYTPQTLSYLPETIDYFSSLGLRQIYLSPDFSAHWTARDAQSLPAVYRAVADRYVAWYLAGDPHYVNLIDARITVLLRGGYHPIERCQMGIGELTITPDGGLYPCERLIGSGTGDEYRIGSIERGVELHRLACRRAAGGPVNPECMDCSMKDCCVNWCGCSNIFMTGYSNRVGPFLCASERAALEIALEVYNLLESRLGPIFLHHLSGTPHFNSQVR